ncbi:MAG: hypothetical protein AABY46_01755 [Nitrospirota bacterium]
MINRDELENSRSPETLSEKNQTYASPTHESDLDSWGQPPIANFYLVTKGDTFVGYEIKGFYASSSYPERHASDLLLSAELEAWELASSESLDLIDRSAT